MKNLVFRTVSGIVYVFLIVLSLTFHKYTFLSLFILFSSLMVLELSRGFNTLPDIKISGLLLIVLNIIVVASFFMAFDQNTHTYLFLAILPVLAIPIVGLFSNKKNPILNVALSFFILAYISLPIGLTNTITFIGETKYSFKILLGIIILIWTNDTFAYIVGMLLGKHKLFERISPKKSWEGFFGGVVFAVGAAYILSKFFFTLSVLDWLVLGVIVSVFGTIGDLVESMLKRQLKLKDIGNILPGHGGILDRNDSFLFVVPAVCLYLQIINFMS